MPKPCGHAGTDPSCRVCWLAQNDPAYRELYAGTPQRCPHLWKRARDAQGKIKTVLSTAPG